MDLSGGILRYTASVFSVCIFLTGVIRATMRYADVLSIWRNQVLFIIRNNLLRNNRFRENSQHPQRFTRGILLCFFLGTPASSAMAKSTDHDIHRKYSLVIWT